MLGFYLSEWVSHLDVLYFKPNLLTSFEWSESSSNSSYYHLLSKLKHCLCFLIGFLLSQNPFFNWRYLCLGIFYQEYLRMTSVHEVEQRVLHCWVYSIINSEFGHQQHSNPLVWVCRVVDVEICFYFAIYAFGFAICLWMVSCGHPLVNAKDLIDLLHDLRVKLKSSIWEKHMA